MSKNSGKYVVLPGKLASRVSSSKDMRPEGDSGDNIKSSWFFKVFREELLEDKRIAQKLKIKK